MRSVALSVSLAVGLCSLLIALDRSWFEKVWIVGCRQREWEKSECFLRSLLKWLNLICFVWLSHLKMFIVYFRWCRRCRCCRLQWRRCTQPITGSQIGRRSGECEETESDREKDAGGQHSSTDWIVLLFTFIQLVSSSAEPQLQIR